MPVALTSPLLTPHHTTTAGYDHDYFPLSRLPLQILLPVLEYLLLPPPTSSTTTDTASIFLVGLFNIWSLPRPRHRPVDPLHPDSIIILGRLSHCLHCIRSGGPIWSLATAVAVAAAVNLAMTAAAGASAVDMMAPRAFGGDGGVDHVSDEPQLEVFFAPFDASTPAGR